MSVVCRYVIAPRHMILGLAWFVLMWCVLLANPPAPVMGTPRIPNLDKVGHFGLFFTQFWLVGRGVISLPKRLFWAISMPLAMLLAMSTELAQGHLTTTRHLEFWDVVADTAGAVTALGLVQWTKKEDG